MTLDDTPKTITGPAIANIFAAVPVIKPSVLNSNAGVCKASDGNKRSGPAEFCELIVNPQARQNRTDKNQRDRAGRARAVRIKAYSGIEIRKYLPYCANQASA